MLAVIKVYRGIVPGCLPPSFHTMGECLRFLDAGAGAGASGSSPSSGSSTSAGGGGVGAGLTPLPLSFSNLAASRAKALHAAAVADALAYTWWLSPH